MSEWKKIYITKNHIKYETMRGALIKFPQNSKFKGYMFWYPLKLIWPYKKIYYFIYTKNFEFKAFKGEKEYRKEVILGFDEIEEAFSEALEEVFERTKRKKRKKKTTTYSIDIPEILEPEIAIVPEELIDDWT